MKAVALFSGGLDSILAIKLVQEQDIVVIAVAFTSPFFISNEENKKRLKKEAKEHSFKIRFIELENDFLRMIRKPKHGHGKNINPCIDCHAFMLRKAKKYAEDIGAKFIFTGEVLDERPMSQNYKAIMIVEKEAGLSGRLLRPLSAKQLPMTEAEKNGWIDRTKLMDIRGRSRKKQFDLAKRFGIEKYETPAGGCLLTSIHYANKLKDLLKHKKRLPIEETRILKSGRHFRYGRNKIIVGRNKEDNDSLLKLKSKSDYMFEAKDHMGPITLLQGPKTKKAVELAAKFTAKYSDAKGENIIIKYGKEKFDKEISAEGLKNKNIEKLRI